MVVVILIVLLLVCAFGWLNQWVSTAALILFAQAKGNTPPSDAEMKACLKTVWKRVLGIKIGSDF